MLSKNPAVGVELTRKCAVKPPVLLPLVEIRRVLQVVPEPKKLNLPDGVGFRSFRTMRASLMRRMGRLEIARDNMGHAGGTGSITLDVYSKSWWEERVDTVTRVVEAVMTEPEKEETNESQPKHLRKAANCDSWVPFWEPQGGKPGQISVEVIEKNGRL